MSKKHAVEALDVESLYRRCPPGALDFVSTDQLDALPLPWGQERAMRALDFGSRMDNYGFNLYVQSSPGTRALEQVRSFLTERAAQEPVPDDWCYLYNFDDAECPLALRLPPGRGQQLRADLELLTDELKTSVPAVFESEEYQSKLNELQEAFNARQQARLEAISEDAASKDVALISTPTGFNLAPMRDGEVIESDAYEALPEDERSAMEARVAELEDKLQKVIQDVPKLRKSAQTKVRELNEEMLQFALGGPMDELRERWSAQAKVIAHLDRIQNDLVENVQAFSAEEGAFVPLELLQRYQANVVVDHGEQSGAPVVYEDLPNHNHLVGVIEQQIRDGAMITDYRMIRAGSLHRASGGYLIVDARRILSHPLAWESLKRVLAAGEVQIESLERSFGLASTTLLTPQPIPLKVKVVLLTERDLGEELARYDPDFSRLFKVEADFADLLDRAEDEHALLARLIATLARRAKTRPLTAAAVGRVIEHGSRLAGDQRKLTARDQLIVDLLLEADHYATDADADLLDRVHIEQAIAARRDRMGRQGECALERIKRGTVLMKTEGEAVGQVNGLAVYRSGRMSFGLPSRITATTRPGRGQVIDIEREAKLGGSIHTKAVMILTRYIAQRYASDRELSLSASLAFEQSYGGVDGDSASVAEVCALLSSLARVGLKQSLAVTGSINQHGEVQAVGGVNDKVEGFFRVCRDAGTLGEAGVLLPASNVENLMLDQDVLDAVERGQFFVYPIRTLDEALSLMVSLPLGEMNAEGHYPDDTFNGRVAARLAGFTKLARSNRNQARSGAPAMDRDASEDDD